VFSASLQEYEAAHAEHYQREQREDWVWWDPPAAAKQSLAVADSWADRGGWGHHCAGLDTA